VIERKYALVTGALGFLGMVHCRALAEVGYCVIMTDLSDSEADERMDELKNDFSSGTFIYRKMDVTSLDSIKLVYQNLIERNIEIEVLVNNAAINPPPEKQQADTRFENLSISTWDNEIKVSLTGTFLCSQVFGTKMAERGSGSIINIASDLSVIAPNQNLYRQEGIPENMQPVKPITYSVIKTAIVGMTRYLATYWANKGVRVNSISPGGVFNSQNKEFISKLETLIPMGRMAQPSELSGAIKFFSTEASSYVTGHNLIVDGGRSIW
jgi:NAD(P)-dependent dehydrogenase (short-subunit alcohol dehydrogenase family)